MSAKKLHIKITAPNSPSAGHFKALMESIRASASMQLAMPPRRFRAVFFDGPFHGQVREFDFEKPMLDLVMMEPPKVEWVDSPKDALLPDTRRHHYRLSRTFADVKAGLYYYEGEW